MSPQEAFHSDLSLTRAAKELGMGRKMVEKVWSECFGLEAVKARAAKHRKGASPEAVAEAMAAFDSDEPFKAISKRLGISPNTLRVGWIEKYGVEAFKERGKRLQQQGANAFGARSKGLSKNRTLVSTSCEVCGQAIDLSKGQLARFNKVLCTSCEEAERGVDRHCPVCGFGCVGVKGLASHIARPQNGDPEAHRAYLKEKEQEGWEGQTEGEQYVMCAVCGFKGETLNSHLKLHGLTSEAYQFQFPGSPLRSSELKARRSAAARSFSYDLSREDLLRHVDDEGRVIVESVCQAHKCVSSTVLAYCRKYDLPTRNRLAWQKVVLDQARDYLGSDYVWEWSDTRIRNPETGRVLNFDGFFPEKNLVIEAHGDQHFRYSENWHGTVEAFEAQRQRDQLKKRLAQDLGFSFRVVRSTDPIYSESFWSALLAGDPSQWENLPEHEKTDRVEEVLVCLRRQGWLQTDPAPASYVRSEMTKLTSREVCLEDGVIRPYSVRGTTVCASFFPNRYHAHRPGLPSAWDAWHDDRTLRKAIRLQLDSGHPTTPERVLKAVVMFSRTPSVFRPIVAKYIYQTYCFSGGVTWDPCAGYGGRLFGAASVGVRYVGSDIERETTEGNQRLAEVLGASCSMTHARAEDFDPGVALDLVFTSPPYFNLEMYGASSDAAVAEYGNPHGWIRKFLHPVMLMASRRLREGGYLVLNLPARPVEGVRLDLAALGLARQTGLAEQPLVRMPVRGSREGEPLFVWAKC